MSECQRAVLPNGLRVLVTRLPYSTRTSTWIFAKGGSRAEPQNRNGIYHLIEHLVFKGGEKFPTSYDLSFAAECAGAEYDAFTTHEYVAYYLTCNAPHGLLGLEIFEDIILHPAFSQKELEIERQTVLKELQGSRENSEELLAQRTMQNVFFGDHPLGREILGTPETIASFTLGDVVLFRKKCYVAKNIVISVAGPVEVSQVFEEVERRFGEMPSGEEINWEPFDRATIPREQVFLLPRKEKGRAHVLIAFPTPGYPYHAELDSIEVLSAILGMGACSRFFQSIREKRGLSYDVGANHFRREGVGVIGGLWGTDHGSLHESIKVAAGEISKLKEGLLDDNDLKRARGLLIGDLSEKYDSAKEIARVYGKQELLSGEPIPLATLTSRIDAVTKEQVLQAAQTYLRKENVKIGVSTLKRFCDMGQFLGTLDRVGSKMGISALGRFNREKQILEVLDRAL